MSFRCQKCGEVKIATGIIGDDSNSPRRVVTKQRRKAPRGTDIAEEQNWCKDCAQEPPVPTLDGEMKEAITHKIAPFDVSDWIDNPDSAPLPR